MQLRDQDNIKLFLLWQLSEVALPVSINLPIASLEICYEYEIESYFLLAKYYSPIYKYLGLGSYIYYSDGFLTNILSFRYQYWKKEYYLRSNRNENNGDRSPQTISLAKWDWVLFNYSVFFFDWEIECSLIIAYMFLEIECC